MSTPVAGFNANPQNINRNGAPKKEWTMAGLLREAMEEEDETGVPYKVSINKKLRQLANRGDLVAIKEVNNRLDGMPIQKNILAGDEDNPIKIDVGSSLKKIYGSTGTSGTGEVSDDS